MTSLYIHIPFCEKKCNFCSFAVAVNQSAYVKDYLAALRREAAAYRGTRLSTVYLGGGTPSSLSMIEIQELLSLIRESFHIERHAEITFECNPESVTREKALFLRQEGVTRASLGVQSLDDRQLTALGRAHRRDEALRAFGLLRQAGFENMNVDLMYGMEGQTFGDIRRDLEAMASLHSEHVSIYALTIEERSLFFARRASAPGASEANVYEEVCGALTSFGFQQYEISNFSRPGFESKHNINYWQGGEYIGLGMAAHSHLAGRRFWNEETLPRYLKAMADKGHAVAGEETLASAEKMMETLLFSLRMNVGIDLGTLQKKFGMDIPAEKIEAIESFIDMGLLEEDGMVLRTTPAGRNVLDEISARLV